MDSASIAPGVMTARPMRAPHVGVPRAHASTPVVRPLPTAANDTHMGTVVAAEANAAQRAATKNPTAEDPKLVDMAKTAGKLGTVGAVVGAPFQVKMISEAATGMLGISKWPVIRSMGRFKTAVSTVFVAMPRAFGKPWDNFFHLRANYLHEVEEIAEKNGRPDWAAKAASAAKIATAKADARVKLVAEKSAPVLSAGGKALDSFGNTGVGSKLTTGLQGGAKWRADKVSVKLDKAMENSLLQARGEAPGFMSGKLAPVKKFFGIKPAVLETGSVPEGLASYVARIEHAMGLNDTAARAAHLDETMGTLRKAVHSGAFEGEVVGRATGLLTQVEKAASSAKALHSYESAISGGLKNVVKAGMGAMGRSSMLVGLVAVSTVAGVSAHIINGRITSAKRTKAYNEFVKAAGGPNSEYIKNFHSAANGQAGTDTTRTVIEAANEVSNLGFAALAGGGGAALGVGQMATFAAQKLVHDSAVMKAYTDLKAGGLSDADQISATRHLLTCTPALANPTSGGYYNRENGPAARALVAKYPDVDARIAVMANPTKFDAFLKEMQAESLAKAKANTANDGVGAANAHMDIKPKSAAEANYLAAEKPGSAVIHGKAAEMGTQTHGRTVDAQRQVGLTQNRHKSFTLLTPNLC